MRCKKVFFHGDADRVIPFEHGERLFLAAAEPKRFHRVPGEGHNTILGRILPDLARFADEVATEK
ncbi:alpha/beta hydrolase [bacterium]|nr:alpha/beta hydrolase [bacterium]